MMDDEYGGLGRIRQVCVVVDEGGRPVAASEDPVDAATFARCLGFDRPLEAMRTVPVIEFAKAGR